MKYLLLILSLLIASVLSLKPMNKISSSQRSIRLNSLSKSNNDNVFNPFKEDETINKSDKFKNLPSIGIATLLTLTIPEYVNAAEIPAAIPSAFAAYGHYLGLVLVAASLTTERLLIKPGMSQEDEIKVIAADTLYGVIKKIKLFIPITNYIIYQFFRLLVF